MLFPVLAFAQDGQREGQNSLLPEINPQDIEIRSEFQARFPGLRRQPILGFNPKPRVFQVDPNRMPFMESREDAVADISVTQLGRPEPPARGLLSIPDRINGYVRAGLGSYLTPEVDAYGFYELNEQSAITGNANLRASNGHLDNQDSGFRYMDVNGKYLNKIQDDLKLTVDIGALSDFNHLFHLDDNIQDNLIGKTSEKSYSGVGGSVSLQKINNSLAGWQASIGGNIFGTELDAGGSSLSGDLDEQQFHTSFSYYWPGQRMYETFDVTGNIEGGRYESSFFNSQSWIDAAASVEYVRLFNFTTRIKGKGGIEYISDPFSDKIYFVPEVEIKHNLSNSLSVTGNAFAKPEMQSVQDHHQQNRFLHAETQLRHAYHAGVKGEVNFQLFDGNRVFGGTTYKSVRDYAYYQREEVLAGSTPGFYNVNYGNANIFELYAGVSQQLVPEKFWADAKLYGRRPKLKSGGDIPYEERLGLEAAISYKPVKALTINSWAEYIGKRRAPAENGNLEAFLLLNAGAEYQINDTFGFYAKLLNMLGQNYELWSGYEERPLQIFGGLTIKF